MALTAGWNSDLDIPSAVTGTVLPHLGSPLVLVSMVDSTPAVADLPSWVPLARAHGTEPERLDGDLLVDSGLLLALIAEHDYFSGFDELWFFKERPGRPKPAAVKITSDRRFEDPLPAALEGWMGETRCLLGLGDGDGLNFVTPDATLAARLTA